MIYYVYIEWEFGKKINENVSMAAAVYNNIVNIDGCATYTTQTRAFCIWIYGVKHKINPTTKLWRFGKSKRNDSLGDLTCRLSRVIIRTSKSILFDSKRTYNNLHSFARLICFKLSCIEKLLVCFGFLCKIRFLVVNKTAKCAHTWQRNRNSVIA